MAQQRLSAPQNLPPQVVGSQNIPLDLHYPYLRWSIWSEGSKLRARGGTLGPREVVGTPKIDPTGGEDPKTYHLMSITHYLPLVHLGVRGVSWERGEQAWAQQRLSVPQNLPPQVVGSPKHTPQSPLPPTSLAPSCSPSLPPPPEPPWAPGTFLGPQEAFGAFRSLQQPWVFSQTQGPCSPTPIAPSRSPSPPEPPWGPGTSRSLQKPSAALGLQSDSRALLLLPHHSLSLPLTP